MSLRPYTEVLYTDNNGFSLGEIQLDPEHKPPEISAINTLSKIEEVMRLHKRGSGALEGLSERAVYYTLYEKATVIRDGYMNKTAQIARRWGIFSFLWRFFCRISAKEQAIETIYRSIVNQAPRLQLPNVVFQNLASFMSVRDIAHLAIASHQENRFASHSLLLRAQEYGYEGDDVAEARNYLNNRFKAVTWLAQHGLIPECCKEYRDERRSILDAEATLRKVKYCNDETQRILTEHFNRALPLLIHPYSNFYLAAGLDLSDMEPDTCSMRDVHTTAGLNFINNTIPACVSLILDYGADPQILLTEHYGLIKQAFSNFEIIKLLLKPGRLDPNAQHFEGDSLLDLAQTFCHRAVSMLLEKGANPNFISHYRGRLCQGLSCFHNEILCGDMETIRTFLAHGANPNLLVTRGRTSYSPLHVAIGGVNFFPHSVTRSRPYVPVANIEIVRLLLQNHANPNIQNNNGNTPLHLARRYGFTEIAELLLNNGADPQIINNQGLRADQIEN